MRVALSISGPIAPLLYKDKLTTMMRIIEEFSINGFFKDLSFVWMVFHAFPRSALSPTAQYVFMIREELVPRKKVRRMEPGNAVEEAVKKLSKLWSTGDPEKRPLLRGSEIVIGFEARIFDYPVTGTIHIRGSGWMRRAYGDIEIITYYEKETTLEDTASLYRHIAAEHGDEIAHAFNEASRLVLSRMHKKVKGIYIQPTDTDLKYDYDTMVAVAHRDPGAHFALVMRYLRKKRINHILQKITLSNYDAEVMVYKKLSSYINYNTLYSKVSRKDEFVNATIKAYTSADMLATRGSLIISSRDGSTLAKAYMNYLDEVISPFVEDFPDMEQFDEWVDNGLRRLAEKYREED